MIKAFVLKRFPLWYAEGNCLLTDSPKEVPDSAWLRAQAAGGLVGIVEDEAKAKTTKARSSETKAE